MKDGRNSPSVQSHVEAEHSHGFEPAPSRMELLKIWKRRSVTLLTVQDCLQVDLTLTVRGSTLVVII